MEKLEVGAIVDLCSIDKQEVGITLYSGNPWQVLSHGYELAG